MQFTFLHIKYELWLDFFWQIRLGQVFKVTRDHKVFNFTKNPEDPVFDTNSWQNVIFHSHTKKTLTNCVRKMFAFAKKTEEEI